MEYYLGSIIFTYICFFICEIECKETIKEMGYKKRQKTLSKKITDCFKVFVIAIMPLINIIMAIICLFMDKEKVVENLIMDDKLEKNEA